MSTKLEPKAGDRRRLVILLVEDEILIRLGAGEMLRDAGHEVIEARNAAEALAQLDSGLGFDLVISDVRMSGPVDGIRLMEMVRERFPETRRLLATAQWPEEGIPGIAHLAKPYNEEMLLDAVSLAAGAMPAAG